LHIDAQMAAGKVKGGDGGGEGHEQRQGQPGRRVQVVAGGRNEPNGGVGSPSNIRRRRVGGENSGAPLELGLK
jgi:hypothetical protein